MHLDRAQRDQLADGLLRHLTAAIPGSQASLRGSLAEGRADAYSDVDLIWDVPDADFRQAISRLPTILERVAPLASLRVDPDFQHSSGRRLVFIRFAGVPLFWRVDLDVFARSVGRDDSFDRDNPLALGADWSYAESSLANAIAALKAHLRGQDRIATTLMDRAEVRVGLPVSDADLRTRMLRLTEHVAMLEPAQGPFAADVIKLADRTLPAVPGGNDRL